MHYLTSKHEIDLGPFGLYLAGEYIVEDMNGATIMLAGHRGSVVMDNMRINPKPFDESKDWNDRKIIIVRPGGFGDILFTTPALKEIKRRWPRAYVALCCFGRFQPIVSLSYYDEIVPYPLSHDEADKFDAWIFLENVIEGNPEAEKLHAIDITAKRIGLTSLEDKKMDYSLTQEEVDWAAARYPRTDKRRVGIQVEASAKTRTYPAALMVEVIMSLAKRGIEVYLLGDAYQVRVEMKDPVRNLMLEGLTFRQSVAAMATCDAVLGPDSVMIHIAGALDIPALGLYGPFPWALRTAYAKSITSIQGTSGCPIAPCFYHGGPKAPNFPMDGPCHRTGKCEVLASIKPERVVSKLLSIMEAKTPVLT